MIKREQEKAYRLQQRLEKQDDGVLLNYEDSNVHGDDSNIDLIPMPPAL